MITASKVKERIQTLIDIANEKTKKNDVDLTSAVNSLIEGGGSGGGSNTKPVYELAKPMTFNGTSDFIDTGVSLFDKDKDFSILIEFENPTEESIETLLHCMLESEPWTGVTIKAEDGFLFTMVGETLEKILIRYNGVTRLAISKSGGYCSVGVKTENSAYPSLVLNTTFNHAGSIPNTLLIGAYQDNDGVKGRFYSGVINKCKVFVDNLPSEKETTAFLMGYIV